MAGAGHQVIVPGHNRHVCTTSVQLQRLAHDRHPAWQPLLADQRIVRAVDLPAVLLQVRQALLLVDRFLRWKTPGSLAPSTQ